MIDAGRQIVAQTQRFWPRRLRATPYYAAMFSASRDVLAFVTSPVTYVPGSLGRPQRRVAATLGRACD